MVRPNPITVLGSIETSVGGGRPRDLIDMEGVVSDEPNSGCRGPTARNHAAVPRRGSDRDPTPGLARIRVVRGCGSGYVAGSVCSPTTGLLEIRYEGTSHLAVLLFCRCSACLPDLVLRNTADHHPPLVGAPVPVVLIALGIMVLLLASCRCTNITTKDPLQNVRSRLRSAESIRHAGHARPWDWREPH